jgi:hypothetical protein
MKSVEEAKKGVFFGVSGSLSLLEKQLSSEEEPFIVVQGQLDDTVGVLSSTSERVIFAGKVFFSTVIKDFSYSKVSSVSIESGILSSKIKIEYSGGKLEIKGVGKDVAKEFVEIVKEKISEQSITSKPSPVEPKAEEDLFDKLKKLGELKEMGVLTEEEFNQQKQKLLS